LDVHDVGNVSVSAPARRWQLARRQTITLVVTAAAQAGTLVNQLERRQHDRRPQPRRTNARHEYCRDRLGGPGDHESPGRRPWWPGACVVSLVVANNGRPTRPMPVGDDTLPAGITFVSRGQGRLDVHNFGNVSVTCTRPGAGRRRTRANDHRGGEAPVQARR